MLVHRLLDDFRRLVCLPIQPKSQDTTCTLDHIAVFISISAGPRKGFG
jgi:hypothetical protein